jgi:hypothetical protein
MSQPRWADPLTSPLAVDCNEGWDARGGQALMDYVVPGPPHGVVLSRHLDRKSMPMPMSERVVAKLVSCGISRLVLGHIPHGNCPTVIQQPVQARKPPCRPSHASMTISHATMPHATM